MITNFGHHRSSGCPTTGATEMKPLRGRKNKQLLHAAKSGNVVQVQRLLSLDGVNLRLDTRDESYERSPLHWACAQGHLEIARLLLDWRGGCNVLNRRGYDILNAKDKEGQAPLHTACMKGNLDIVSLLLERGAHVDAENGRGITALHMACLFNRLDVVHRILLHGAKTNPKHPQHGSTPLHWAANKGHLEVARALVTMGAKVDERNYAGWTPLHCAFFEGRVDVALFLVLDEGADLKVRNREGKTPLDLARNKGSEQNQKVIQLFETFARAGPTNPCKMTRQGVRQPDVGETQPEDYKEMPHPGASGADLNHEEQWQDGTPLHFASLRNSVEDVRDLVLQGANVNAKDPQSRSTPLHWAASKGHLEVTQTLVEMGGVVNERNDSGWTPLHCACVGGHIDVALFLVLDSRADPTARSNEGQTPLDLAKLRGLDRNEDIIQFLETIIQSWKDAPAWAPVNASQPIQQRVSMPPEETVEIPEQKATVSSENAEMPEQEGGPEITSTCAALRSRRHRHRINRKSELNALLRLRELKITETQQAIEVAKACCPEGDPTNSFWNAVWALQNENKVLEEEINALLRLDKTTTQGHRANQKLTSKGCSSEGYVREC